MDPLSIASAVTGLVALAGTTLNITLSYASRVKHRRQDVEAFVRELKTLKTSLESLDELFHSNDGKTCFFHNTSVLTTNIYAAQAKLSSICRSVQRSNESSIARLTWPFSEKEHERSLQQIRNLLRWVQLAMTADGYKLLSKTSEEVVDILRFQLEEISMLRRIDDTGFAITTALSDHTSFLKDQQSQNSLKTVLKRLSPYNYEKKHKSVMELRMPGSGSWLLQDETFLEWRHGRPSDSSPNVLFCQGIPGSGKSVLISLVIDYLRLQAQNTNVAVVFVYFDYREPNQHSVAEVLRNLLKQSLTQSPRHAEEAFGHQWYEYLTNLCSHLDIEELRKATIASLYGFNQCYVVVDAFDECLGRDQPGFIKLFAQLASDPKVRLLITSRNFSIRLRKSFPPSNIVQIEAHSEDLQQYILYQINQSGMNETMNENFKLKIINKLLKLSRGMFLLPVLQLNRVLQEPTLGDMEDALVALPVDLAEMYQATFTRIQQQMRSRQDLAIRAISWVLYAYKPLTMGELQNALAIRPGQKHPLVKYQPSPETILESCQGLLQIVGNSFIAFSHYTVQEFTTRRAEHLLPLAKQEIAQSCITYLSFDEFSRGPCMDEQAIEIRLNSFPLLEYAASYWGRHVAMVAEQKTAARAESFLQNPPLLASMIQTKYYVKDFKEQYWDASEANSWNGLMVACNAQLEEIAIKFVDNGLVAINSRSAMGTTPINQACSGTQGFVSPSLIRRLLSRGADPLIANWYGNALHCAAEAGNADAIAELTSQGIDLNLLSPLGLPALSCTTTHDCFLAASILLDGGASPRVTNVFNYNFTEMAIYDDAKNIIAMLIERGVLDLEEVLPSGRTPLGMAIAVGSVNAVQLLADAAANVKASKRETACFDFQHEKASELSQAKES